MEKVNQDELDEWLLRLLTAHIGMSICGIALMVVTLTAGGL